VIGLDIILPGIFPGYLKKAVLAMAFPLLVNLQVWAALFIERRPMVKQRLKWLLDSNWGNVLVLAAIYLGGVVLTLAFNNPSVYGPSHLSDELDHWIFARWFATGQGFPVLGAAFKAPFYPLMIVPAFWLGLTRAYSAARVLNVY